MAQDSAGLPAANIPAKIELLYRVRIWPTICVLLLFAVGIVGATAGGVYLYHGGDLGVRHGFGALLRGKPGALILGLFAAIAAAVEVLLIASWRAIARSQPRVVLEPGAITVPSKWRLQPTRIPLATITRVIWRPKKVGKVGYIWLCHATGKAVIVEDLLGKGDAQRIVDWVHSRKAAFDQAQGDARHARDASPSEPQG
jgi:hypothetical protein